MIHRASKEQVEEYFADPRIGQSKLKLLMQGVKVFNTNGEKEAERYFEEKEHYVVGSAVDCLLTAEEGTFDEEYYVSDVLKPSDAIMSIVQFIFDVQVRMQQDPFPASLFDIVDDYILHSCTHHNYQPNYKDATKVSKIRETGNTYYMSLVDSMGKNILGLDQYNKVTAIVESIRNNESIKWIFEEHQNIDVYFQKIIFFTFMGVDFKAMLDILIVDHTNKTIQVADFKTMFEEVIKFVNAMKLRRYDIQGTWYNIAVQFWYKALCERNPQLKGYKILNPSFIVETTKENCQGNPKWFVVTQDVMAIAFHGMSSNISYTGKDLAGNIVPYTFSNKIMGISELVKLYKWHLTHGFQVDKEVLESGDIVNLGWGGIIHENTTR